MEARWKYENTVLMCPPNEMTLKEQSWEFTGLHFHQGPTHILGLQLEKKNGLEGNLPLLDIKFP